MSDFMEIEVGDVVCLMTGTGVGHHRAEPLTVTAVARVNRDYRTSTFETVDASGRDRATWWRGDGHRVGDPAQRVVRYTERHFRMNLQYEARRVLGPAASSRVLYRATNDQLVRATTIVRELIMEIENNGDAEC